MEDTSNNQSPQGAIGGQDDSNIQSSIPAVSNGSVDTEDPASAGLDTAWTRWKCMVCNFLYEGRTPLKECPRCHNSDPDKFLDIDE